MTTVHVFRIDKPPSAFYLNTVPLETVLTMGQYPMEVIKILIEKAARDNCAWLGAQEWAFVKPGNTQLFLEANALTLRNVMPTHT